MSLKKIAPVFVENTTIPSVHLGRDVIVDFYLPKTVTDPSQISLLLINDGQNLQELKLENILNDLYDAHAIHPVLCAGIHANENRKVEYGTAKFSDYLGRGAKASLHNEFVLQELIPYIRETYKVPEFKEKAFAGFSLGGLSALDMVWNYPSEFTKAGVFSGSLWWRSVDQSDAKYDDNLHRIMHQQIKNGSYHPWQSFYFTTGSKDETMGRNNNGIIDSIDDTLDLIKALENIGYKNQKDICYINYEDGKHDIATWARAMPDFLKWGWGK